MNVEIWQRLLSLESIDIVGNWFTELHGRTINARRSKEIVAAARQAREFFRNANEANFSVKPLLSFYGVASLSRATTLLLRKASGESSLTRGHGLETYQWPDVLSGETSIGIRKLGELKIRTCGGLFYDFLKTTENIEILCARDLKIDKHLRYPIPCLEEEISLHNILERLPDVRSEYSEICKEIKLGGICNMTWHEIGGFTAMIYSDQNPDFRDEFDAMGYDAQFKEPALYLKANPEIYQNNLPQFTHVHFDTSYNSVLPLLTVVPVFKGGGRYSELCIIYMLSYILGMLTRYFPTHWVSLIQGERGDAIWPTINRAHQLVEELFPKLIAELISDKLEQKRYSVSGT